MLTAPRICVLIPVFNHGLTVGQVVRGAQAAFPVLVVDDGSTDDTPAILAREPGLVLLTLPCNQGKGAALRAGFGRAGELGFTHVITLDADGQHPIQALGQFAAACRARPEALIVGVRNLRQAGAPWARRASNALSNFWFRFETGLRLTDTQCGYRVYPLVAVNCLRATSERYAFELEVLVRAAWAGIPLEPLPVAVDYAAPTSRLSHFDSWHDLLRICRLHARLSAAALVSRRRASEGRGRG
jgi:glycosyltransferase involved in cell wall biosynthesis